MADPRSQAERWFRQASHDLRAVRWNIEGGFFDTACFLAQQPAEKALKSLLYYLGLRRSALLTHSLVEMVQEAAPRLPRLAEAHGDARLHAQNLDAHNLPGVIEVEHDARQNLLRLCNRRIVQAKVDGVSLSVDRWH